jgi:hypothetical protein
MQKLITTTMRTDNGAELREAYETSTVMKWSYNAWAPDDPLATAWCSIYSRADFTMQRGHFASKSDEYLNHKTKFFFINWADKINRLSGQKSINGLLE